MIVDHGLRYEIDLAEGQKTGFYLDQRENRVAAARYFRGRRVLDMFCYSGGFAMTAAAVGGAARGAGHRHQPAGRGAWPRPTPSETGWKTSGSSAATDFKRCESLVDAGRRFGGVVLDPPKFARSRRALPEALRAYHWLNRLGVALLEPGGSWPRAVARATSAARISCTCSSASASRPAGRSKSWSSAGLRPTIPVSTACPESEYLKCFICRVV